MSPTLPTVDVVLLGVGHTNAHVLRAWKMGPLPGVRLTCVSSFPVVTYSGMLPGVLAGLYPPEQMEIDLVRACAAAGARLIVDEVSGIDHDAQRLLFSDRAPVRFDVLSIGIGSVPTFEGVEVADASRVLAIKPMQTLLARLDARLRADAAAQGSQPVRVVIVGGGAGGVEVALCLPNRVQAVLGAGTTCAVTIITGDERLVPGSLDGTARRVAATAAHRGIGVVTGRRITRIDGSQLTLDDGASVDADVIVWATGAAPPPLLASLGLPTDDRGFLRTTRALQSTSGAPIFIVGDTGAIDGAATSKAGVYAVRQGPVLWDNVQRLLAGRTLRRYTPQRGFLKLLNTGNGRAIGEWKGVSFEGGWAWRLKDTIDRRFMRMHQDYTPMPMAPASGVAEAEAMRCMGCGGKVGAGVLSRALARLDIPASEHVRVGLDAADDAAVVVPPGGRPLTVTVDFFAAPFDDPYAIGRVAALNAASDVFAIGATPFAALAMVTLPVAQERQQEELLYQLLAGSLRELRHMGATLVGGHTIEGPQLTVGFTLLASQTTEPPRTKGRLRAGDALVLTKPIGTGILLAAHMRADCRAPWFTGLVRSMLASNAPAAQCLDDFDVSGLTDVTGFGLGGHLREMLEASGVAARLHAAAMPLLPGVSDLLRAGTESTLAPANRERTGILTLGIPATDARVQALFDPQTCGGLLIGVAPAQADALVRELVALVYRDACVIGHLVAGEAAITID